MLEATWEVTLELAPWLLLGTAIASLLHVTLPPDLIRRQLRGPWGVFKAVVLGIPLPLCSCGVIPAGLGLKKDGASDGASVGFLIATPQTGVDSILVAASFLGWPFALFKVGSALLMGTVGGWATDMLAKETEASEQTQGTSKPPERSLAEFLSHGMQILRSIWGWLVFGVVVSAAITTYLPAETFRETLPLAGLTAGLAMLLISLPLYVCATASVPIAAALVAGGMPPGAALVFLMAGPATNVATIGAVHRGFGTRPLAVYLGTVVLGSLGLAMAFDALFPPLATGMAHDHHADGPVAAVSALVLIALMAWFAVEDLRERLAGEAQAEADETRLEIQVEGMTCGGCARKLSSALMSREDVRLAEVSAEEKRAVVFGTIDDAALRQTITEVGFEAR